MNPSGRVSAAIFAALSSRILSDINGEPYNADKNGINASFSLPNQPSAKTLRKRAKREALRKLNLETSDAGR